MIIKRISIKNFKSFGNNKQDVTFNTTSGELILLRGKNGSGKSSFQQCFDFSLFGIVRGKNGKRIPQNILPNRINKNLETEIEYINNSSDVIKIQRHLEPNLSKIFINDLDQTKKFKNLSKEERDKIIGFDYDTYKSFISLSVSDFANFINLTPEDKRNIINRLFNLQDLDNYLSICNGIIKELNEKKIKYKSIIEVNQQTINTLNSNIITIKRSGMLNKENEIKKLEEEKNSKKEPYTKLKNDIKKYENNLIELNNNSNEFENLKNIINNNILETKVEIKNIEEKLNIYKSGKCPVCNTDLNNNKHIHDLTTINENYLILKDNLNNYEKERNDIILKLTQISNKRDNAYKQISKYKSEINNITYQLKDIVKKISELKNSEKLISTDELQKNIDDINNDINKNIELIENIDNDIIIYEELKNVFSVNGIRKNIISHIIKPININIKEILDELNSSYIIKINEDFDVDIYERLINKIHPETLSTGETKTINIAIALSYLRTILKFRKLNILFLDEVFSSMEPDKVELTLKILKNFTKEFNLNIIILDPKVYFNENSNTEYFDRIMEIDKKMSFSSIKYII